MLAFAQLQLIYYTKSNPLTSSHLHTMTSQKVILILGSGPNVGHHVSRAFAAKGYKVALASRSLKKEASTSEETHFQVDLSNPAAVPDLFTKVKEALGVPSVVVYNGEYSFRNPLPCAIKTMGMLILLKRPRPPPMIPATLSQSLWRNSAKT
jgi:NAD(P)-dependent dehydrogenase (short-subunit alcohol dehydrogenase family)